MLSSTVWRNDVLGEMFDSRVVIGKTRFQARYNPQTRGYPLVPFLSQSDDFSTKYISSSLHHVSPDPASKEAIPRGPT